MLLAACIAPLTRLNISCEFLIELPDFTGNTSYCYGSNETVDNTIQQISNVACDRNVTWSLRAANVSGFSLEVLWYFADLTSMYGSYWVDKSRIVKGGSGGQIVEFYVGQHNFTMYNVSEVLGSQGGGTER